MFIDPSFIPVVYRNRVPFRGGTNDLLREIYIGLLAVGMRPVYAEGVNPMDSWQTLDPRLQATLSVGRPTRTVSGQADGAAVPIVVAFPAEFDLSFVYGDSGAGNDLTVQPLVTLATCQITATTGDTTTWFRGSVQATTAVRPAGYRDNPLNIQPNLLEGAGGSRRGLFPTTVSVTGQGSTAYRSRPDAWSWHSNYDYDIRCANVEVVLSRGGLTVLAGTGFRRSDCANILAFTWAIDGQRFVGREPLVDHTIAYTNPVTLYQWACANTSFSPPASSAISLFNSSSGLPFGGKLGAAARDVSTGVVKRTRSGLQCQTANVFNCDRLFRSTRVDSANSPLRLQDATTNHLIGNFGVAPVRRQGTVDEWYTELVQGTSVATKWEDGYIAPHVAFLDTTAAYRIHTDPVTGKDWFVFKPALFDTCIGLDVTGYTLRTREGLAAAEVFPVASVTHNLTVGSGSTITADGGLTVSASLGSGWVSDAGSNLYRCTFTSAAPGVLTLTFNVAAFQRHQYWYALSYEGRFIGLSAATQATADVTYALGDDLYIRSTVTGASTYHLAPFGGMRCAGDDSGDPFYTFSRRYAPVFRLDGTGNITVRVEVRRNITGSSEQRTVELRNLRLHLYELPDPDASVGPGA
jgi:hypothetical protein